MRKCLMLSVILCFANTAAAAESSGRPNYVVVLCDDLGYGELACYGSKIAKTPHLDRFAKQGLQLTQCYAGHPNCSSSRAALLTGRIPFRAGIHNWIPQGSPMHLRTEEITLARLLQRAGYATCLVGKWHLSGGFDIAKQPTPGDHGFDYWFATQNVAVPSHKDPENFYRNGKALGKLPGYSAQIVAAEATEWLAHKRDKDKPFFLFVSLHEPHEKIATDPRFLKLYPSPKDPSLAEFWGNVSQIDDAFGQLMKTLDDLTLTENTLVFFTSDNGAALTAMHPHGSTGGLRGKKSQAYEGGVRVPGLFRWPGRIRPNQTFDEPVSGIDLLPTLCALAKVAPPADRAIDGANFAPIFDGKPVARKTPLYWQFHRADSRHKVAMRVGDWKLYATITGPQLNSNGDILDEDLDSLNSAELDSFALYHLGKDRQETNDLATSEKERVGAMAGTMRKLFDDVRKESPRWPTWMRFPAKGDVAKKASRTSPAEILAEASKSANVGLLNLNFTTATDADLKKLAGLKQVRALDLHGTDVSDASLSELAHVKELETLNLSKTAVTDTGLKHLAALRGLRSLNLSATKVTDAGLEILASRKQLQTLDLRQTAVSAAAAAKLRKRIPGLSIQQ